MSESKQRLRPWLENILNEESVPGVRWINEEKNKFKIPWKHHGKQDWQESDAEIFMQWARHTGKYREDIDSKEFATWKTRLRCALNKAPDIEELKDVSKLDCTNPYRVYLLKDKREVVRKAGANAYSPPARNQRSVPCTVINSNMAGGELPSMLADLESDPPTTSLTSKINSGDLLKMSVSEVTDLGSLPNKSEFRYIEEPHTPQEYQGGAHSYTTQENVLPTFKSEYSPPDETFGGYSQQDAGSCAHQNTQQAVFTVKLLYDNISGDEGYHVLSNSCRLRCEATVNQYPMDEEQRQQVDEQLYGPKDIPDILFKKKGESKEAIYENLSRGVTIECDESNGNLYINRYCKLQVFHASEVFTNGRCIKVPREEGKTLIFNHETEFNLAVQQYLQRNIPSPPSPDVYLLFGKSVDDITDDDQKKGVHLMVVITTAKATSLIEKAKQQMSEELAMDMSSDLEAAANAKDDVDGVCISKSDDWDNIQKLLKESPQIVPVDEKMSTISEIGESLLCSDLSEMRVTQEANDLDDFLNHIDELTTHQAEDV